MTVNLTLQATKLITERRKQEIQAKKIKTKKQLPNVVFLSAHATDAYKERAEAVGGDGFIAKPFQLPRIENALQSVLSLIEDGSLDESIRSLSRAA